MGGTVEVTGPRAGNHGPVQVANRFHFAHADGTPYVPFGTTCYDDLQLVSMTVTSPNDKVTQTLDFVKGPPYIEVDDPSGPGVGG